MLPHFRRLVAGAFALMSLIAFSSPAVASTGHVAPQSATRHHAGKHHNHRHHHAFAQHNGGDQDADNNGGPSDGDGNV